MGNSVPIATIMPCGELINISAHVLFGKVVESSNVAALQESPKGLDAIGMCHIAHVLADRVFDGFMLIFSHALVCLVTVRVDRRAGFDLGAYCAFQVGGVSPVNRDGP